MQLTTRDSFPGPAVLSILYTINIPFGLFAIVTRQTCTQRSLRPRRKIAKPKYYEIHWDSFIKELELKRAWSKWTKKWTKKWTTFKTHMLSLWPIPRRSNEYLRNLCSQRRRTVEISLPWLEHWSSNVCNPTFSAAVPTLAFSRRIRTDVQISAPRHPRMTQLFTWRNMIITSPWINCSPCDSVWHRLVIVICHELHLGFYTLCSNFSLLC